MRDDRLHDEVMEALLWEPSISRELIGVRAVDGLVTLHGYVGTFEKKQAAERAARRVAGARFLASEIAIRR